MLVRSWNDRAEQFYYFYYGKYVKNLGDTSYVNPAFFNWHSAELSIDFNHELYFDQDYLAVFIANKWELCLIIYDKENSHWKCDCPRTEEEFDLIELLRFNPTLKNGNRHENTEQIFSVDCAKPEYKQATGRSIR